MVTGEEVRVAGATVGEIESVGVTMPGEIDSYEDGKPQAVPGKAVIAMKIEDPGFQDFRSDASCLIRPQSLIGEKFVDCRPTLPRAPGSKPAPALKEIPEGEPGAGQYLLPLENNSTSVDPDLINNINQLTYAQRFRLILNELGAGLAGRGEDVEEVVKRANPVLRDADRVFAHPQRTSATSWPSSPPTPSRSSGRSRASARSVAGFFSNAGAAGAGERRKGRRRWKPRCSKLPAFLRELRATMGSLEYFSEAGTPVAESLAKAAPALTEATRALTPFSAASTVSLKSLGATAKWPGRRSAPPTRSSRRSATSPAAAPARPPNWRSFLVSTRKTKGFDGLADLIYNSAAATNEFDRYGHFTRSLVALTNCIDYVAAPTSGCSANFNGPGSSDIGLRLRRPGAVSARCRKSSADRAAAPPPAPVRRHRRSRPPARPPPPAGAEPRRRRTARRRGQARRPATCPPRLPPGTMRNRSGIQGVASSPVIVGAVTVLVVIVAVFLAYNANNGLPFVSTYDLKARVPNANALVKGNEVRIGGSRVGVVKEVKPVQIGNGAVAAELDLSLDKSAEPIPVNSTMIIRPKSPLGLKYLQIVPGDSAQGPRGGRNDPALRGAARTGRHRPVLRHVRREDPHGDPAQQRRLRQRLRRPRPADQRRLRRPAQPRRKRPAGAAHAGRPEHQLRRLLGSARGPLRDRRPGRRDAGEHVRRPRPHLRRLRPRLAAVHPGNDRQRPADARRGDRRPAGAATLLPRLRPLLHRAQARRQALGETSPTINAALRAGIPALNRSPALFAQLTPTAEALLDFQDEPGVFNGLDLLIDTNEVLDPAIKYIAPAQTTCNYLSLVFRNLADAFSESNGEGNWLGAICFEAAERAERRVGAVVGARRTARKRTTTSTTTPTRDTGQDGVCEAGNERYAPGKTDDRPRARSSGARRRGKAKADGTPAGARHQGRSHRAAASSGGRATRRSR